MSLARCCDWSRRRRPGRALPLAAWTAPAGAVAFSPAPASSVHWRSAETPARASPPSALASVRSCSCPRGCGNILRHAAARVCVFFGAAAPSLPSPFRRGDPANRSRFSAAPGVMQCTCRTGSRANKRGSYSKSRGASVRSRPRSWAFAFAKIFSCSTSISAFLRPHTRRAPEIHRDAALEASLQQ